MAVRAVYFAALKRPPLIVSRACGARLQPRGPSMALIVFIIIILLYGLAVISLVDNENAKDDV